MKKKANKLSDVFIIVNPNSASGKTAYLWKNIENEFQKLFEDWDVAFTENPGHASELAAKAIDQGCKTIISVGGDGTINEVVQGFFDKNDKSRKISKSKFPSLGFISAGTGSDFIKSLSLPKSIPEQIAVLKNGNVKKIDTGRVDFVSNSGKNEKRHFINIADIGIGGEVVRAVNKIENKGVLNYNFFTLLTLLKFQSKKIQLTIDKEKMELDASAVIVANGKYFGGGMKIAPDANIEDGLFDVIVLPKKPKLNFLLGFTKVRSGNHIHDKDIIIRRGKKVIVNTFDTALLDVDGEQPGRAPVTFGINPKSISVILP
jgi:YegS/Rv2252/BmrU family lipid kinase